MYKKLKQLTFDHLKNTIGWRTKRKIIVFSVDDYGNVRIDSKKARENMDKEGLKRLIPSDYFDTLETREDLEMLFEVLNSVKDSGGRPAVFTPFALPCNINFEKINEGQVFEYEFELLPTTFQKLSDYYPEIYNGTWKLWKEGISLGLMKPQFHGREHLNIKLFNEKLQNNDHEIITNLKNRSFAGISRTGYDTIDYTAAFDFSNIDENNFLSDVLLDGIYQFNFVFGYRPSVFTPPMSRLHPTHLKSLAQNGIKYLHSPLIHRQHMGDGQYKRIYSYTGKKLETGQIRLVRNVLFEPTDRPNIDNVKYALNQIETAFFWNRPAIISSHRVNFCGLIDSKNRLKGLYDLKELLQQIVKKWPEVEFMSADELGNLIHQK